jgi:hypothetical protein
LEDHNQIATNAKPSKKNMTLTPKQLSEYRELKDHAVEVSDSNQIEFNSGSETIPHVIGKALVGHIARHHGYRVSSEVVVPNGEIDIILWGNEDRLSYAVELETSPNEETKQDKLERYVKETPLDDMILLNLNEMPINPLEAAKWIQEELGV